MKGSLEKNKNSVIREDNLWSDAFPGSKEANKKTRPILVGPQGNDLRHGGGGKKPPGGKMD